MVVIVGCHCKSKPHVFRVNELISKVLVARAFHDISVVEGKKLDRLQGTIQNEHEHQYKREKTALNGRVLSFSLR